MTNQTFDGTNTRRIDEEARDKRISQLEQEIDMLGCFSLISFLLIVGYVACQVWGAMN